MGETQSWSSLPAHSRTWRVPDLHRLGLFASTFLFSSLIARQHLMVVIMGVALVPKPDDTLKVPNSNAILDFSSLIENSQKQTAQEQEEIKPSKDGNSQEAKKVINNKCQVKKKTVHCPW